MTDSGANDTEAPEPQPDDAQAARPTEGEANQGAGQPDSNVGRPGSNGQPDSDVGQSGAGAERSGPEAVETADPDPVGAAKPAAGDADDGASLWAVAEGERPRPWVRRGLLALSALLAAVLLGVMGYAVSRVAPAGLFDPLRAGAQPSGSPVSPSPSPGAAEPCVNDSASDLEGQGTLPPYAEIVKACLRPADGGVRLELTVGAEVPARMPDADTSMIIGFGLRRPAGEPLHVTLQGNADGWAAYRSDDVRHEAISEQITRKDKTIAVTLQDADLKPISGLQWTVETHWTKSSGSESGTPAYAVDSAPDSAAGSPGGSVDPPGGSAPTGSGYPTDSVAPPPGGASGSAGASPDPSGKGVG